VARTRCFCFDSLTVFDEVVIAQESQIAPAFILHLARDNFSDIAYEWNALCDVAMAKDMAITPTGDGLEALKKHNSLGKVDLSLARPKLTCSDQHSHRDGARTLPGAWYDTELIGLYSHSVSPIPSSPKSRSVQAHIALDLAHDDPNPHISVII
jgi:hypothetical protein